MKLLEIHSDNNVLEAIQSEVSTPTAVLLLAHGAGAGMNHTFMESLSSHLAENHIEVVRFNFPYMTAGKKFPGSPKSNIQAWSDVIDWAIENFQAPIFIGGKSYGGRMGSHVMAENAKQKVKGLIYYGFPLHAPGRDSVDRAKHLSQINVPQLFLQGSRDALAKLELMKQVASKLELGTLKEILGGDHSFKVKGMKPDEVIEQLAKDSSGWISNLIMKLH